MPRFHGYPWPTLMLALGLGLVACSGEPLTTPEIDAGGSPDAGTRPADAGVTDAGVDPVVYVPEALPSVATAEACVALEAGERVLGVSPDGHLWLGTSTTAGTEVRVLDPWALDAPTRFSLPVRELSHVQAHSATVAAFVADGSLYIAEDGVRTVITTPTAFADDATLCGDPRGDAYVFSDGRLFQRVEDEWVEWTGVDQALDRDARLLARDGACASGDDAVWFATGALELWALAADELSRPAELPGASQPGLLGTTTLALMDGRLFAGPGEWTEYAFDAGEARLLATAGDYAWIVVSDRLVRFDGETFEATGTATDAVALWPTAAGGVWLQGASRACHTTPQGNLRVAGDVDGHQSTQSRVLVRAWTRGDADVTASLDGAPVTGRATSSGTVFTVELPLGWHALTLSAGDVTRSVHVKRVPTVERSFATDVKPIFDTHCVACHVPDNNFGAPDLSTLEAWRARATKIRERVIEVGDMPPSNTRSPDWGEDEVTVIDEWLSGGYHP